jgi:IstB-like ATP binding protein
MTDKIDAARINLLLGELRLPGIKLIWAALAQTADKEGWPAARFLAALGEQEMVERRRRRLERHLEEARLPPGKTIDATDDPVHGEQEVRGMRRSLTDDEQHKVAGAIVEHLEHSNWKIERGPMPEGQPPLVDRRQREAAAGRLGGRAGGDRLGRRCARVQLTPPVFRSRCGGRPRYR